MNKSFKQFLTEMPRYYPGEVVYQSDKKFQKISVRNVNDYTVLGEADQFVYLVHPQQTFGFVFFIPDLTSGEAEVLPVMRLALRDTKIKTYKQAYQLRIRESYSKINIAQTWYMLYVKKFGGIVSDTEHLPGGKNLWKSFIRKSVDSIFHISAWDNETGKMVLDHITDETPDSDIWSEGDNDKKHIVLVFEKK